MPNRRDRTVAVAVALGLLLTGVALAAVLAQRGERLAATNSLVEISGAAVPIAPGAARCALQTVPEGAASVRIYAGTFGRPGGPVAVSVAHAGRIVTGGRVAGGYPDDSALVIPLRRETAKWPSARVCVRNLGRRPLRFAGNRTPVGAASAERDDIRTDWLLPGRPSWAGLAGRIAERFAAAKPRFFGAWTLWALAAGLALLWATAIALVARRWPWRAACVACAAVAFANGAIWALVTPPLQVPDEGAHFGYVQYVAERGELPRESAPGAPGSNELNAAAAAIPFTVEGRPTWFREDLRAFHDAAGQLDRRPPANGLTAANHPPLYYVLQLAPYAAARSAGFFDRLLLMRLLSCVLAALAVACVFLFVRELLPGHAWGAPVGALAATFQPVFGFMSGGVNNDNLTFALAALLFYLVARALRRGVTAPLAVATALTAAAGMLTKTSFAGLLPGVAVAGLVAIGRLPAERRRRALAIAAGGALAFAVPVAVWLVANQAVFDRPGGTTTGNLTDSSVTARTSLAGHLSYVWQAFLPALPGMQEFRALGGAFPLWDTYVQGFVGRFGWWHFGFPLRVSQLGLGVYVAIVALASAGALRARAAIRGRWPEVLVYAAMAVGYLVLIELAAYRHQALHHAAFEQARYLLPLLALYGAVVAVAATTGGRRGPALGAFLVVLALAHSLFAMLLVVGHYYA